MINIERTVIHLGSLKLDRQTHHCNQGGKGEKKIYFSEENPIEKVFYAHAVIRPSLDMYCRNVIHCRPALVERLHAQTKCQY